MISLRGSLIGQMMLGDDLEENPRWWQQRWMQSWRIEQRQMTIQDFAMLKFDWAAIHLAVDVTL